MEGKTAPDFIAPGTEDGEAEMVKLFELIGANEVVVLQFCPAAFVPPCTAELCAISKAGWSSVSDLEVVGLTGDSLFTHVAYANQYDINFPLVSDFHGGIADSYGLRAQEWEGHSQIPRRATVVVDSDWRIRAVESVAEPLNQVSPAPVARATATIRECGLDLEQPEVRYDAI